MPAAGSPFNPIRVEAQMAQQPPLVRGAIWSLATAVTLVPAIGLGLAVFHMPLRGDSLAGFLDGFFTRAILGGLAGIVAAIFALIPYTLLFALWLALVRRFPNLEGSWQRLLSACFVLSLPLAGGFVWWTGAPPGGTHQEAVAFIVGGIPGALASSWAAVYVPRRLLRVLRRTTPGLVTAVTGNSTP